MCAWVKYHNSFALQNIKHGKISDQYGIVTDLSKKNPEKNSTKELAKTSTQYWKAKYLNASV